MGEASGHGGLGASQEDKYPRDACLHHQIFLSWPKCCP